MEDMIALIPVIQPELMSTYWVPTYGDNVTNTGLDGRGGGGDL